MIELTSVSSPPPTAAVEFGVESASVPRIETPAGPGVASEESRSRKHLIVSGKSGPLRARGDAFGIESILGVDERVRILDTDLAPWRMICALRIRGPGAATAIGTGWLAGPRTVITAGHCVFYKRFFGGWATRIEVSPGRNGSDFPFGTVVGQQFRTLDRWINNEDEDFDIGCIRLEEPIGEKVGWFSTAAFPASDLEGFLLNLSGYPSDRGAGTEQYHHKNRVLNVTERRVFYDVDSFGGQSGAPVWIHETPDSVPIVIGIHAYGIGGSPHGLQANSAPRIIPEVLDQIRQWVKADGGWPEHP